MSKEYLKQIDPGKEYVLIVNEGSPKDYAKVTKKFPQIKLVIMGDVTLEELKPYLAKLEN